MRRFPLPPALALAVALAPAGLALPAQGGQELKLTAHLAPPSAPKSEYRVGYGRDPFFPNSTDTTVLPVTNNAVKVIAEQPAVPDFVELRGVSTTNGRRLAIINHQTVSENEEITLRQGGRSVTVRCVEIKQQSVVISVGPASKELFLREP